MPGLGRTASGAAIVRDQISRTTVRSEERVELPPSRISAPALRVPAGVAMLRRNTEPETTSMDTLWELAPRVHGAESTARQQLHSGLSKSCSDSSTRSSKEPLGSLQQSGSAPSSTQSTIPAATGSTITTDTTPMATADKILEANDLPMHGKYSHDALLSQSASRFIVQRVASYRVI